MLATNRTQQPPTSNRGVTSYQRAYEPLPKGKCILIGAGVDWLTLTSVSRETQREMQRYFGTIVAEDLKLGYKVISGGNYGFYGKRAQHALLASKEDRMMLQVSSERARQCMIMAREGDNATRLDLQVTIRIGEENISDYIGEQEKRALACARNLGAKRTVRVERVDGAYQTLYIGSRQSDKYVRIYDKFAESGEERYRGCVRLEIEYKNKASKALWTRLAEGSANLMWLLQVLLLDLSRTGVDTSIVDLERQDIVRPKARPTKEERTLGWWASQVAPSVARVSAERGWQTAMHILFGQAMTEHDRSVILNSFSIAWGS